MKGYIYKVPDEFYFRIHHVRPRFKIDPQGILFFVASQIKEVGKLPTIDFNKNLDKKIRLYPGNLDLKEKTIKNWRTEISSLFGFIQSNNGFSFPSFNALELASNGDIVQSFKRFLFTFQYPGAHTKPNYVAEQITRNIKFKPAKYLLSVLDFAEKYEKRRISISKEEACHCIFNDLRVTSNLESPKETWLRIKTNREIGYTYDSTGDVIRYAGDIIDYMELANLLETHDNKSWFINRNENFSVLKFLNSNLWFKGYDFFYGKNFSLEEIQSKTQDWFSFVNNQFSDNNFETNISSLLGNRKEIIDIPGILQDKINQASFANRKEIGDIGEALTIHYEKQKLQQEGAGQFAHLVMKIPTPLAVGYDIQSMENNGKKKYIEVKTTISTRPMNFSEIHMTANEWSTADTLGANYYVYRIMITKTSTKLYIINNPVDLYRDKKIRMIPSGDGANIYFDLKTAGFFQELNLYE